MSPLTEIHLFKGQSPCSAHTNYWFTLLPRWLLANKETSAPLSPGRIAFIAFCTVLKAPLALNKDKEDPNGSTNSSGQITRSFSGFDHTVLFQLFKEQIARRSEKLFLQFLFYFWAVKAAAGWLLKALSAGLSARNISERSFLCGLIFSCFTTEI